MKNYRDNHPLKFLEELESVERDFEHVCHHSTSLPYSRHILRQADENHTVLADRLNSVARLMLKHLGTEYEAIEFDTDSIFPGRQKERHELINNGRSPSGSL